VTNTDTIQPGDRVVVLPRYYPHGPGEVRRVDGEVITVRLDEDSREWSFGRVAVRREDRP
jgi:hypothetical protein